MQKVRGLRMKKFDSGVKYYTHAHAVISVHFPEDDVCCMRCPYYSRASGHCQIDKNITPPRPDRSIDVLCPLKFEEIEKE